MAKWKPESDDESDLESEGGFSVENISSGYLLNRHNLDAQAVGTKVSDGKF